MKSKGKGERMMYELAKFVIDKKILLTPLVEQYYVIKDVMKSHKIEHKLNDNEIVDYIKRTYIPAYVRKGK